MNPPLSCQQLQILQSTWPSVVSSLENAVQGMRAKAELTSDEELNGLASAVQSAAWYVNFATPAIDVAMSKTCYGGYF
jgi:hypothetical protein